MDPDDADVMSQVAEHCAKQREAERVRQGGRDGPTLPPEPVVAPPPVFVPIAPTGGLTPTFRGAVPDDVMIRHGCDELHLEAFLIIRRLLAAGYPMPGIDLFRIRRLMASLQAAVEWSPAKPGA